MRVQPRLNEAVNEEWISDKTRYAVDGLKRQRLDTPLLRKEGVLVAVSWKEALAAAASAISSAAPERIGCFAGPLVDVESLVCAKDLFNALGSTSTYGATALSADLRPDYVLNSTIAGIEEADALLLVGTNPRVEAPLVNARIRKMVRHFDLPVAAVGAAADLTFEYEHLGTSADALSSLLSGSSSFAKTLSTAEKPIVLLGLGATSRADGAAISALTKEVAKACGAVKEGWNGYGLLQTAGGAVGALDIGFVPGPTAVPLEGLEVVYLMGADEVAFEQLDADAFVIYQGHHGDSGASAANLVLPGCAYTEKSATYVSTEGRTQRAARAIDAPGDAREDWSILVALSMMLSKPLPFASLGDVRERMVAIAPHLAGASGGTIEAASAELSSLSLAYAPDATTSVSSAPLVTAMANFYMSDPVSRASATMAKCTQAFGTRV
jgi:NADH-quinone oxidoreductase subunit G